MSPSTTPPTHQGAQRFVAVPLSRTRPDDDGVPKIAEWARVVNRQYGVGFQVEADAIDFAASETERLNIPHDITPHTIHRTPVVVYDVTPRAMSERKVA